MSLTNGHRHDAGPSALHSDVLVNTGLGVVFALGVVFTAYMLIVSWGGAYWIWTTAVAVVVCGLALLRGRRRVWPPAAGLAVAAGAVATSLAADLPREPSPMTALALSVLIGSALRSLPAPAAVAIAAGGTGVTAFGWYAGHTGPMALATLLVVCGFATGSLLRAVDLVRRRSGTR